MEFAISQTFLEVEFNKNYVALFSQKIMPVFLYNIMKLELKTVLLSITCPNFSFFFFFLFVLNQGKAFSAVTGAVLGMPNPSWDAWV